MDPQTLQSLDTTELIALAQSAPDAERTHLEDALVRRYQPMARRLVRHYSVHGWDHDDLLQVASLALLKAVRRFNSERGCFEAYAKSTINGELKNHLRDHSWTIKPPRRVQELVSQVRRTTTEFAQVEGVVPGPAQLAEHMGHTVEAISEAMSATSCSSPSSIDQPIEQTGRPLSDTLASDESDFDVVDGRLTLAQLCRGLSEDDLNLIRLRFYECLSQREIADEIGVSQMQVSRRLARLMDELRSRVIGDEMHAA